MTTPEGKVKAAVNKLLAQFDRIYRFMPVPGGFGMPTLDYLICANGYFLAIETKDKGKHPTGRQKLTIADIEAAEGTVFVIRGVDDPALKELEVYLAACGCERKV